MAVELGTVGEWAAAVATGVAVWVAVRQPRATISEQARHAAELEAAQVVATCTYFDDPDGEHDLPRVSATVRIQNYSASVLRCVRVRAQWSNGHPYFLWEYGPAVSSVETDGSSVLVELHHLAPSTRDPSVPIGANPRDGEPDPVLQAVTVSWLDRGGVERETAADIIVFPGEPDAVLR